MTEKKPGFFKRLFKFGKKSEPEPEEPSAEQLAQQEAQSQAETEKAEQEELQRQREEAERAEQRRIEEQNRQAEAVERERVEQEKARQEGQERLEALAAEEAQGDATADEGLQPPRETTQVADVAPEIPISPTPEPPIESVASEAALEPVEKEAATAPPAEPEPEPQPEPDPIVVPSDPARTPVQAEGPEQKKSWFSRLKGGLARSSNQLTESITGVFTKRKLDEDTLQDLEDVLIRADLGVDTAMAITDTLASQRMGKDITSEEVRDVMAQEIEKVLDPVAAELELDLDHRPHVILVVGVNGSGKTTTIGKLSQKLNDGGFSTLLVAGDTFRAAAIEQLKIWGDRTGSPIVSRALGADAAGLAFDAYEEARQGGHDVMLMDTAGRLQNRTELMDELAKIVRVLKKQDPDAPHTVLLTLDATTGQNALNQVEIFKDVAGVNGLVMTKLDGTARGGILVAISAKHKLPIFFIGVGEQADDLEPFEARDFARSIAGLV
ncbi:MAG: signal recognition particle-docking protein FtsY [Ahrensia sp.]|nr:signal recognition particle-docking protein FtsY [Ahrensia sp.]